MIRVFCCEIPAVLHDPLGHGADAIVHHDDGLLVVEGGIVVACGAYADLTGRYGATPATPLSGLIVPGFVDTHVHYPQVGAIAVHGAQLLDWLERHVFPAEAAFADRVHADRIAGFFLDELLRVRGGAGAEHADRLGHGAGGSRPALVARYGHRRPGAERGADRALARARADRLCGHAALRLTSTDAQLTEAGALVAAHPDVLMHTRLAENHVEVAAVADRRRDTVDHPDVYDRFGPVGPRSALAHCLHPEDRVLTRRARAGAGIACCPTSNLFLGSGLFDLARADSFGVRIGIGSDVGAGTDLSILHTIGMLYPVSQLRGQSLDPFHALHLATAGAPRSWAWAVASARCVPGRRPTSWCWTTPPRRCWRTAGRPLIEQLFALQILGDDRAAAATYVTGERVAPRAGVCP